MDSNLVNLILLIVQIASLIALIFYVIKTWEMASASRISAEISAKVLVEMRDARDQEIAPYIIVYFDKTAIDPAFYLVIRNIGKSMAYDVQIEFDPPLKILPVFQPFVDRFLYPSVIPTMAPNYEIKTSLGIFMRYCQENHPELFSVKVNYFGGIVRTHRSINYKLDLSHFHGLVASIEQKPNKIADALETINETGKSMIDEIILLQKSMLKPAIKKIRRKYK
jgi:hypothetical protein